jgi:short-subunit dehydrogenase
MTRVFLPGMMERKRGRIMSICSVGAVITVPALNVYCATKFGLNGFMQGLGDELLVEDPDNHIKLTTVYPDIINTRKEAMDLIDKMNHFIPKLAPERVADEAVSGMLMRKEQVFVSNTLSLIFAMR